MRENVDLQIGDVIWIDLGSVRGHEQAGHRPAIVVASTDYLATLESLAIVVPVTTRDRGWPNHVPVHGATGLPEWSWAMTEQPRTIARARITRRAGSVDDECLASIRTWLRDFLDL